MLEYVLAWHEAKRDHGEVLLAGARMRLACDAWAAEEVARRTETPVPRATVPRLPLRGASAKTSEGV